MIDPIQLTLTLQNLNTTIYSPSVTLGLDQATLQFSAMNVDLVGRAVPALNEVASNLACAASLVGAVSSLIPRAGEEINNGIKALSSPLTDFPSDPLAANVPKPLLCATTSMGNLQLQIPGLQRPLGEVTAAVPIAESKIMPALNSAEQSIAGAIAGSEVTVGFNNIALTIPTPLAVSEALGAISAATQNVIPSVSLVIPSEISGAIEGAISGLGALTGITSGLAALSGVFSSIPLPNLGFMFACGGSSGIGGVLGAAAGISAITGASPINAIAGATLLNATGLLDANVASIIPAITGVPLLDALHNTHQTPLVVIATLGLSVTSYGVFELANRIIQELTYGTVSNALLLLQYSSDISADVIANPDKYEKKLLYLQFAYGGVGAMVRSTITDKLGLTNIISPVSGLALSFGIMSNMEEGYAELISSPTPINSIQIGWTETYIDDLVTKDTIVPQNYYHYIVLKNGTIQRGKQIGSESEIKIAIVGGYNVNRGEFGVLTETSIAFAQSHALRGLLEQLIIASPGVQVYGLGQAAMESNSTGASYINPGVDIPRLMNGLNGQTEVPSTDTTMPPRIEDLGLSTSPTVIYCSGFESKIRGQYIQKQLMSILINVCVQTGLYATIVSGGQMSLSECKSRGGYKNGKEWYIPGVSRAVRTGSVRHDNGWAADLTVYRDASRSSSLNFSVNSNPDADVLRFVRACKAAGIQAVGAGPGYMAGNLHVDISAGKGTGAGSAKYWGKEGATPPQWLAQIMG